MIDHLAQIYRLNNNGFSASLLFKEENKYSTRNAVDAAQKISLNLYIPRICAAVNVSVSFLSESYDKVILSKNFSWFDLDNGQDVFCLNLKKGELGAGLYFLLIKVESGSNIYYLHRHGANYYLCDQYNNEQLPQMTVVEYKYQAPSEILGGVIYHVFADRFCRGGRSKNKKDAVMIEGAWDRIPEYPEYPGAPMKNNTFYGGTLDGIRLRLDYIKSLGVSVLYLSPIFESASNHRYDTADYMNVDPLLGGDEALLDLISDAKKLGIKIILDGVFNHTGADSKYFNRYKNYGEGGAYNSKESSYYPWFNFKNYPDSYVCWWDIKILPRINPDIPECGAYFTKQGGVIDKYRKMGIYGMRLDVADELSDDFLSRIKDTLSIDGESYLLGEVWEDASNKIAYGKRKRYFQGKELDGVMNYPLRRGIIDYLVKRDSNSLYYALTELYDNTPKRISNTQMNILGTHDTVRILTELSGVSSEGLQNSELAFKRLNGSERETAKKRLFMAYAILSTLPGIPSIYYGDEVGLEGYSDPFNRMPYPYGKEDEDILSFYRKLGEIRRLYPVYREGDFRLLILNDELLVFSRDNSSYSFVTLVNNSDKTIRIKSENKLTSLFENQNCQLIEPHTAKIIKTKRTTKFTLSH